MNSRNSQHQLYLPDSLVQSISAIAHSERSVDPSYRTRERDGSAGASRNRPDFSNSHQWVKLCSNDGSVVLYFDPVTKQVWGEGSGSDSESRMNEDEDQPCEITPGRHPMEDFGDDEINAAARLVKMSDSSGTCDNSATPTRSRLPNVQLAPQPDLATATRPAFQSRQTHQSANLSFMPCDSDEPYVSTAPAVDHSGPSGSQFRSFVESDAGSQPRPAAAHKGKRPANLYISESEGEPMSDEGEMFGRGVSPMLHGSTNDHPATVNDILRLGDSIRVGQMEMAQMIIDGLRPQPGPSVELNLQDPGNDGDVEESYSSRPRGRKSGGPKRCNVWENLLSKIRKYMQELLKDSWMENTVTEQEANAFDPTLGQCCDPAHFRVHLEGTTCNTWNKSATSVFAGRFLTAHPEYPSHEQSVRDMVQMKSRAALDSMIREYRKSNTPRTEPELREEQKRKNRQERKRKLYHRRRDVTFLYPSLVSQRPLLEQLGPAGMSSDEERTVGHFQQYDVVEPAWRSDVITAWLRIFDALHSHAKKTGVYGDQRGSAPRMRVSSARRSTNGKFVHGLPRNAYDDLWFDGQIHPEDTVRPGPPVRYFHNAKTLELACKT